MLELPPSKYFSPKFLVAQAFQPAPGQPGAAVLHILSNFSGMVRRTHPQKTFQAQLRMGLWPTRKLMKIR